MIVQDFDNYWMGLTSGVLKAPTPLVDIPVVEQVFTRNSRAKRAKREKDMKQYKPEQNEKILN